MSACFQDKCGLNSMKFLRCVTGLWLPYIHKKKRGYFTLNNHKKEGIPVKKGG
jgi:hypothetical protein